MKTFNWTRRTKGGIAIALAGVVAAGAMIFGSGAGVSAQTTTPPSATASPLAGAQRGPGGRGMMGMRGERGFGGGAAMTAVAKALGVDEATLRTELQAGKTIADLAKAKNIDTATIVTAIVDAEKASLAQAVTDGKLTQAQADERLANAQTRATDMVNGVMPMGGKGGPGGMGGRGFGGGAAMTAVAKALSTDEATLRTELQAGKTIADLAKAKGVDTATIVTAIVDAEKASLAQAVTDGKLTQAQADERLVDAQTRATDMVNGVMPMGGKGGPGGMGGRGFGGGAAMTAVAKALSTDEATLRTELQAGKTIADLAKAKGVDTATIVMAIVDAEKASLAQAVTDGKLTQAQADERLANAQTHATDMVNGVMPQGGPGGKGGHRGPGGMRGLGGPGGANNATPAAPPAEGQGG